MVLYRGNEITEECCIFYFKEENLESADYGFDF
jgi:hypothetical protein